MEINATYLWFCLHWRNFHTGDWVVSVNGIKNTFLKMHKSVYQEKITVQLRCTGSNFIHFGLVKTITLRIQWSKRANCICVISWIWFSQLSCCKFTSVDRSIPECFIAFLFGSAGEQFLLILTDSTVQFNI